MLQHRASVPEGSSDTDVGFCWGFSVLTAEKDFLFVSFLVLWCPYSQLDKFSLA